ncbi:hypothetical protein PLICRDRAFT_47336 [Plicaturopsis crispa FD-325 SS-3]|uniref:Unplaced genomic scaffold PLICRscaffold_26, whole genome shotgun sequence n=1 Tax=Plicaturopsis crispa FD-325 SS-3 TaxID=944288 RepID=A0A0C9SVW5_PLICR|nr:hypothetical protein PLICRDRAFT_47336 [Plicaturopsis crispa FD-325 SS-3]
MVSDLQVKVDALIQEAARGPLPAVGFQAYARDGTPIVSSFAGVQSREEDPPKPIKPDTAVFLASCTKLITSISALQLVERGLIALDDPVGKFVKQVDDFEILEGYGEDGKPKLRKPKRRITLRHLLTHSSGLAYSFFSPNIARWVDENKGVSDPAYQAFEGPLFRPLLFEPGEGYVYGVSLDIAGLVVEAVSGLNLEDYIRENITKPLHIEQDMSFFRERFAKEGRLATQYSRGPDGTLTVFPVHHLLDKEGPSAFPGGLGLFGTAPAYIQVLLALANGGAHLATHARILKPETVALLTTPQFDPVTQPNTFLGLDDFGFIEEPKIVPGHSWHNFKTVKKNHGLGGLIIGDGWKTGRSGHSLSWAGMFNTMWWIDLDKGVVGFFEAQVFPYGDPHAFGLFEQLETAVYEDLAVRSA